MDAVRRTGRGWPEVSITDLAVGDRVWVRAHGWNGTRMTHTDHRVVAVQRDDEGDAWGFTIEPFDRLNTNGRRFSILYRDILYLARCP